MFSAKKYANEQKPEEAPTMKAKLHLNKFAMDRLRILFCTVHAINLQGWPVSDYHWMSELDETKGLNIGTVYWRSQNCHEFADAIAEVQCNEVQEHLGDYKYVSVIVDGSMDSSITDNVFFYIQTCLKGVVFSLHLLLVLSANEVLHT